MFYSDNPIADAENYAAEQDEQLEKIAKCDRCGEPIYEKGYKIDGELLCLDCVDELYGKDVSDYGNY